ncbi:MAG: helix-turn-helix domain-containing protein [Pseudomonadota bacterium]
MTDPLLSDREAAAMLGCARSSIWRWASDGVLPKPLKIGGMARWRQSVIQDVVSKAEAEAQAA